MRTLEKPSQNGKKVKNLCNILQKTGKGVKMAADGGYKAGYFMAKHPGVEVTKQQLQKNYKPILVSMFGFVLGALSILQIFSKMQKDQKLSLRSL